MVKEAPAFPTACDLLGVTGESGGREKSIDFFFFCLQKAHEMDIFIAWHKSEER